MKRLIMLIVICMMFAGCSKTPKEETMGIMEKVSEQVTKPLVITVDTLESQYNDNDKLISHVKIEYPIIENKAGLEGLNQINLFFEESAQALFEENDTYASDSVETIEETAFTNNEIGDAYYEYFITVEIKYNEYGLLSVLQNFKECNYDIDNTNRYSTGYVFDIDTGERLNISDILAGTEDEVNEIVGQAFMNSDKIADSVKSNYQEELLENTQYIEFYMDHNNLNLFYNPDMAASYTEGILEASIPLNTDNVFKLDFK